MRQLLPVKGYATLLAGVALFVLLLAMAGFVISNSRITVRKSIETGELSIVDANAYGDKIILEVKNISSVPLDTSAAVFFVNHVFQASCRDLNCPPIGPGESFTVELNGGCGAVVTVDYLGKRSSMVVSQCFPRIFECNDCITCRNVLTNLNNAGPAIVRLVSDINVDSTQVLSYSCIYLRDLNLQGVIFDGGNHTIYLNWSWTGIKEDNVMGLEIRNIKMVEANWNGFSAIDSRGSFSGEINGSARYGIYISGGDLRISGSVRNAGRDGYDCIGVFYGTADLNVDVNGCGESGIYVNGGRSVRISGTVSGAGSGFAGVNVRYGAAVAQELNVTGNDYGILLDDANLFIDGDTYLCGNGDQLAWDVNSNIFCRSGVVYTDESLPSCPLRPC